MTALFKMKGMTISAAELADVIARAETRKVQRESGEGGSRRERNGVISELVLASTLHDYPECRCEELVGLRAGMTVVDAIDLGAGCCDSRYRQHGGWVCPRLDKIRRTYGR